MRNAGCRSVSGTRAGLGAGGAPGWLCHLVMLGVNCRSRAPSPDSPARPPRPLGALCHRRKGKGAGTAPRLQPRAAQTALGSPAPPVPADVRHSLQQGAPLRQRRGGIHSYCTTRGLSQQLFMAWFLLLTH